MPGELVIYKERASCFFGTALSPISGGWAVDNLIICGESTSGCVRASDRGRLFLRLPLGFGRGMRFDRSMLSHKVNLFDLHHKYADVMHVGDVIAASRRPRPDPQGRVIFSVAAPPSAHQWNVRVLLDHSAPAPLYATGSRRALLKILNISTFGVRFRNGLRMG